MKYKMLGKTDIKVSQISLGCWPFSGDLTWGEQSEESAITAIKTAYDAGINFFDNAEAYGNGRAEKILGKAVKSFRNNVIVATKVSGENLRPADLKKSCENSLKRLNTDYIDIYYIHYPNHDIPIAETFGAMEELKQEGKIRIIGCSNFGKNDLNEILEYGKIEVNQLPYNLLWRAIEYEVQDACIKNDVSIVGYSPIAQGLLTGKFKNPNDVPAGRARTRHFSSSRPHTRHGEKGAEEETFATINKIKKICSDAGLNMLEVSLAWVLAQPGVASIIVGARTIDQIKANIKAVDLELDSELIDKLNSATNNLKEIFGKNPDLWQSDSRFN